VTSVSSASIWSRPCANLTKSRASWILGATSGPDWSSKYICTWGRECGCNAAPYLRSDSLVLGCPFCSISGSDCNRGDVPPHTDGCLHAVFHVPIISMVRRQSAPRQEGLVAYLCYSCLHVPKCRRSRRTVLSSLVRATKAVKKSLHRLLAPYKTPLLLATAPKLKSQSC
jgi:hypothetical protein